MIDLIYFSSSGHTHKFMHEYLDYPKEYIHSIDEFDIVNRPYILLTPTYDMGQIPKEVSEFLDKNNNHEHMKGVVSFGNRNWGAKFANAGPLIMNTYQVPLLAMIEMSGDKSLATKLRQKIDLQFNN